MSPRRESSDGQVPVCPACNVTGVRRKTRSADERDHPEPWTCEHCGAHFDEPRYRERYSDGGRHGAAHDLIKADPGEWP